MALFAAIVIALTTVGILFPLWVYSRFHRKHMVPLTFAFGLIAVLGVIVIQKFDPLNLDRGLQHLYWLFILVPQLGLALMYKRHSAFSMGVNRLFHLEA